MQTSNGFLVLSDFSRRSSYDVGDGCRESEVVMLKERRLVPIEPVREGMLRFSFLLETCTPGSVPDPQLVAAVLDLVSVSHCLIYIRIQVVIHHLEQLKYFIDVKPLLIAIRNVLRGRNDRWK